MITDASLCRMKSLVFVFQALKQDISDTSKLRLATQYAHYLCQPSAKEKPWKLQTGGRPSRGRPSRRGKRTARTRWTVRAHADEADSVEASVQFTGFSRTRLTTLFDEQQTLNTQIHHGKRSGMLHGRLQRGNFTKNN